MRPSMPSWRTPRSRFRSSSSPAIRPGIWSAACTSISRRTGRTKRPRSPFWLPIRRGFRQQAKAQHVPLGKALQEYAGAKNRERLLSLLMPVQRAAEQCGWLKAMVDAGEIYHPLRWSPQQALRFLKDAPALESAGVVVRMPASWRMNRPARPQVKATVGGNAPSQLGSRRAARFPHGGDPRRRKSFGGRDQTAAGAIRRPGLHPRQVGRGRS